jgi:hypothetical protein
MEFIVLVLVAVAFLIIGINAGWNAREHFAKKVIEKHLRELEQSMESKEDAPVPIKIEEHDGVFFVYNKEDNSFMAQGKDKSELENVLNARFPGKRFAATQEELQKAGLLS